MRKLLYVHSRLYRFKTLESIFSKDTEWRLYSEAVNCRKTEHFFVCEKHSNFQTITLNKLNSKYERHGDQLHTLYKYNI